MHNPNIDPACFPLLHIRGTQGWRFGLKKKGWLSREDKNQVNMEKALNIAAETPIEDDITFDTEAEKLPDEEVRNELLRFYILFFPARQEWLERRR
jgi:hypothetical protein